MIIRCPRCEHSRSVNPESIPDSAELATCPKCQHRFRFRVLEQQPNRTPAHILPASSPADIWDAVDSLHRHWQSQLVVDMSGPWDLPVGTPVAYSSDDNYAGSAGVLLTGTPEAYGNIADAAFPVAATPGKTAGGGLYSGGPLFSGTSSPDDIFGQPFLEKDAVTATEPVAGAHASVPGTAEKGKEEAAATLRKAASAQSPAEIPPPAVPPPPASVIPVPVALPFPVSAPPAPIPTAPPLPADTAPVVSVAPPFAGSVPPVQSPGIPPSPETIPSIVVAAAAPAVEHIPPGERAETFAAVSGSSPSVVFAGASMASQVFSGKRDEFPAAVSEPAAPYTETASTEERVERDLRMLRDDTERPSRDLGRLEDISRDVSRSYHESVPVPWESGEQFGKIRPFISTIKGIMFDAVALFKGIVPGEPLSHAYLFFLLQAYIAIICTMVWGQAARNFLQMSSTQARLALPVLLLMTPLALGVTQMLMAGWINTLVRFTAPAKANFSRVFKMIGYAASPLVLCIIPFVGPVAAAAWFFVGLVVACRHGLGLGWTASLSFPVPPGALFITGMIWFFL